MNDWSDFDRWLRRVLYWQTAFMAGGAALLWLTGYRCLIDGWLAGTAFNLAYFVALAGVEFLYRDDKDPLELSKQLSGAAIGRFPAAVLFLVLVLKTQWVHFGAAVAGLVSMGVVFYLEGFTRRL